MKFGLNNVLLALLIMLPELAMASTTIEAGATIDLTSHWAGYAALIIFIVAYLFVMTEEITHLRKSKPVVLAAGLIWIIIAYVYSQAGLSDVSKQAVQHNFLEFSELFFFLLVAMTYINSMEERGVFSSLRSWMVRKGFSYRQLFWITGLLAFFISPIADNLTTALLMGAVILAIGVDKPIFVTIGFINVVIAANAGVSFSPFGDITTLMVWQNGIIKFQDFLVLFVPAFVNFVVPAIIMYFVVPKGKPTPISENVKMKRGSIPIIILFLVTIATAVLLHTYLNLPPVLGMMIGLGYLQLLGYYLKISEKNNSLEPVHFDVFNKIARSEWDTLLFFFGVILAVGGLGTLGYLAYASQIMYTDFGATNANILVGILSAIVDNIPVMFAVLTMNPDMSQGQWLLVTLTAGVGGSLLSVGSAAGVALMGQSKGLYTFAAHLKWTPVILLGYFTSIGTHLWLNSHLF